MNSDIVEPYMGIIFYRGDSDRYMEAHTIKEGRFQAPVPINQTFLENLITPKDFTLKYYNLGAKTIFYQSTSKGTNMCWEIKAHKRELLFDSEMDIESGIYPIPTLIINKIGTSVSIYAIKESEASLESKLYFAPLPNNSDTFCFGKATWKEYPSAKDTIHSIEKAIFESLFSEFRDNLHNVTDKSLFYNNLLGKDVFPIEHLKPFKKCLTLNKLLQIGIK